MLMGPARAWQEPICAPGTEAECFCVSCKLLLARTRYVIRYLDDVKGDASRTHRLLARLCYAIRCLNSTEVERFCVSYNLLLVRMRYVIRYLEDVKGDAS